MDMGSNVLKRNENKNNYRTIRILLPAHENAEDYTDKYGVCHTVVEKEKFYKCTRRTKTMEHYSIWKMSLSHNDNLVRKNYWNARRLDPLQR
jgi:hypothetical protein